MLTGEIAARLPAASVCDVRSPAPLAVHAQSSAIASWELRKARAKFYEALKVPTDIGEADETTMKLALMRAVSCTVGRKRGGAEGVAITYRRPNNGHHAVKKTARPALQRVK